MHKKHTRLVVEQIEKRNLMSTLDPLLTVPTAYVEPAPPAPAPITVPLANVGPAPVELAFNPDITRLPSPIQTDSNPVLTMFQVGSGQATIVDPAKVPTTPPLSPPPATLPPLPPPLPTTLPGFPSLPLLP